MASEPYRIELRPAAVRELEGLAKSVRSRVVRKIESLATDPRPAGVKKLAGEDGLWRVRIGDYRVIYTVHDAVLLVLVVTVAHRREAYR